MIDMPKNRNGIAVMNERLTILESKHVISMIIFIRDTDGCKKIEIYQNVSRNAKMAEHIRTLQDMDVIETFVRDGSSVIGLTEKGRMIADLLKQISDLI